MTRMIAVRLRQGELLKERIEQIVRDGNHEAASVVCAVGSLSKVVVRMAGAQPDKQDVRTFQGSYEVVSLIGNLGPERTHLHVAFSDENGVVIGGHMKEGSVVHTTLELTLLVSDEMVFQEEMDEHTGFGELRVVQK